mmetsp:Transcript_15859/g.36456  ORF Transcript_15859/g.36456 Transcript_15859/m.36456 type:complete len:282 (-) Transcript_15859:1264-2109(-)
MLVCVDESQQFLHTVGRGDWFRWPMGMLSTQVNCTCASQDSWLWRRWWWPSHLAFVYNCRRANDWILPSCSSTSQCIEQGHKVAPNKFAGLRCHGRRVICLPNDGDTRGGCNCLILLRERGVATSCCCQVHDHRARAHRCHHLVVDDNGSSSIWNHGCAYDHIHLWQDTGIGFHLSPCELISHLRGIPAASLSLDTFGTDFYELGTHALNLLSGSIPDVVGENLRAKRMGSCDCAKSRNACANYEHSGWWNRATCRHRGPAKAREAIEGVQYSLVPSNVRH